MIKLKLSFLKIKYRKIKWLKNAKLKYANEYIFKKIIDKDKFSKFCGLVKKYIMKTQIPNKKEFLDALMGN